MVGWQQHTLSHTIAPHPAHLYSCLKLWSDAKSFHCQWPKSHCKDAKLRLKLTLEVKMIDAAQHLCHDSNFALFEGFREGIRDNFCGGGMANASGQQFDKSQKCGCGVIF